MANTRPPNDKTPELGPAALPPEGEPPEWTVPAPPTSIDLDGLRMMLQSLLQRLETVEACVDALEDTTDSRILATMLDSNADGAVLLAAAQAEFRTKGRLYRSALSQAQQWQGNTKGVLTDLVEWMART